MKNYIRTSQTGHWSGLPFALTSIVAIRFAGALLAPPAQAGASDHWPQWRGPLANGVAPQANPPVTWSETENIKWKVRLPGSGTATPIIWENQVFVSTAIPTGKKAPAAAGGDPPPVADGGASRTGSGRGGRGGGGFMRSANPAEAYRFTLLSLDRQTGQVQWEKVLREEVPHEGHHRDHGFASHSPVTDGQHVYAYFGSRGLHCLDLKGNLKWSKDLGRMQTRNAFGEGSSPALHGDTLVITWDHEGEDDFTAAFDKHTGKELWRQAREEATSWSTPLVVMHDGKPQVITSATSKIRSYDLATGKLIWECAGMTANVISTPVAADGMVYPISGHRGSALLAIRLGRAGDLTDSDAIVWRHGKHTPYVPSPLLYGDRLYFFSGNNAMLSCFEANSGQALIDAERLDGMQGVYASPVGAAGRVYLTGRNGVAVVIKDSDKLEVLATNKLNEGIDASPAAVGHELFLRGREHLFCIAER
jgi:outer membrane protein assembly factor BamB